MKKESINYQDSFLYYRSRSYDILFKISFDVFYENSIQCEIMLVLILDVFKM